MLKEKYKKEIDGHLEPVSDERSAVIPLLYLAQGEEGYVVRAGDEGDRWALAIDPATSL